MAMNLRLGVEAEAALRAEAERSGRSQQELLREALDRYLDLSSPRAASSADSLLVSGVVRPPRAPYRRVQPTIGVPEDSTSLELLDRAERL